MGMPAASAVRERAYEWGDDWERTPTGLLVPHAADREAELRDKPIGIGLFVGAGGFDLGMTEAGFHVVAANEWDAHAAVTYLCNLARYGAVDIRFVTDEDEARFLKAIDPKRKMQKALDAGTVTPEMAADFLTIGTGWISSRPDVQGCELFWFGDVTKLSGEDFLEPLGLQPGEVDVVFGGPPCQGFSRAGKQDPNDDRNELVFEFMRLVCEINPKTFVMENVPGMLGMVTRDGIPVIDAIARIAEDGGFGTFDAIRKSLANSAGVGAALKTKKAKSSRKQPQPGVSGAGHVEVDPAEGDQFELDMSAAAEVV